MHGRPPKEIPQSLGKVVLVELGFPLAAQRTSESQWQVSKPWFIAIEMRQLRVQSCILCIRRIGW